MIRFLLMLLVPFLFFIPSTTAQMADLSVVQPNDGIEKILIRQFMNDPVRFGFKGAIQDKKAIRQWAEREAGRISIKNKYVRPKTGEEVRVRHQVKKQSTFFLETDKTVTEKNTLTYLYRRPTQSKAPIQELPQEVPIELPVEEKRAPIDPIIQKAILDEANERREYDLHLTKGKALFNANRYQDAKAEFDLALFVRPEDSNATYHKGVMEAKLGQLSEAETNLVAAINHDPPVLSAYVDLGALYYQQKGYQKGLSVLEKGIEKNPKEPLLYFYQGKIYQEMNDHDTAVGYFLKSASYAREAAPEIYIASKYHAGVSYYRQKSYSDAKDEFLEVVEKSPKTELGDSSQKFLALIAKSEAYLARQWALSILGGLQFDSNVLLTPTDPVPSASTTRKSDSRFVITFNGNYQLKRKSALNTSLGYFFYQSLYSEQDPFNTQVHQGSAALLWKNNERSRRLDYRLGYTGIDQKRYLLSHALRATAFLVENTKQQGWFFYQLQQSDFIDSARFLTASNRDGLNHALGVGVAIAQEKILWRAGYTVDLEAVRVDDWSYLGHQINAGVQRPIFTDLLGQTYLEYNAREYKGLSRLDQILKANIDIAYRLIPQGDISLGYSYTRNQSNIESFDYRRGITALNFTKRF